MFLFSRSTSAVTLLSRTPAGVSTAGNGESLVTSLSADGTVVSFGSYVTDLVAGQNDANNGTDLFGWKSGSGVTLGSHIPGSTTTAANHRSAGGRISANGALGGIPVEGERSGRRTGGPLQ